MRTALPKLVALALLAGAPLALAEASPADAPESNAEDLLTRARSAPAPEILRSSSVSSQTVTFPTDYSLSLDGDLVFGGDLFKEGYPFVHTDGGTAAGNTALGFDALISLTLDSPNAGDGRANTAVGRSALRNTTSGIFNSAVGTTALYTNTEGDYNTALGAQALFSLTTGNSNTALGRSALGNNSIGSGNTASGDLALFSSTGSFNVANGYGALRNLDSGSNNTAVGTFALFDEDSGSNNIAVGFGAGSFLDDGSNNIYLGHPGESTESDTIRIGDSGTHTATFVAGVRGTSVANGLTVLVGSLGRLGTTTSSRRFKEEIRDMGNSTDALLELRPVTFRYRMEAAGEGPRDVEFGLVAEEVAEILPELVAYDDRGEPYAVRYHLLPAMLLNELQRERQRGRERERARDREIHELRQQLEALEAALTRSNGG